jgi:hypothetical protein
MVAIGSHHLHVKDFLNPPFPINLEKNLKMPFVFCIFLDPTPPTSWELSYFTMNSTM